MKHKLTHLRSLLLVVLALLVVSPTMAQKQGGKKKPTIEFSTASFQQNISDLIAPPTAPENKKAEAQGVAKNMGQAFSALSADQQGRLVIIYNALVERKTKAGDALAFTSQFLDFYGTKVGKENLEGWLTSMEVMVNGSKKDKDALEFAEFAGRLATDRVLAKGSAATWQTNEAASFRLVCEDRKIRVVFEKPIELHYATKSDNGTLYGTKGTFFYQENRWVGRGGRLYWDRAGVPKGKCWGELAGYSADCKKAAFTADSVKFVNTDYFTDPILGRVDEEINHKQEPDKYHYPKFKGYQGNFVMKDYLPGVDYEGSFMMNGGKMVTNDPDNPAHIVFYRGKQRFIVVTASDISSTHSKFVAKSAGVKIYHAEGDSIVNQGVQVQFNTSDKKVRILNKRDRNFCSPFTDSYHRLDLFCEIIEWVQGADELSFASIGSEGNQSAATFESSTYFSDRKARELQGVDELSPVMRVGNYINKKGVIDRFYIDEFAKFQHLDIVQSKAMMHNLAKSGLLTYNEGNNQVIVTPKLFSYVKAIGKVVSNDYDAITLESSAKGRNAQMDLKSGDMKIAGVKKFVLSDSQRVAITPYHGDLVVKKNREITFSGKIEAGRFVMFVTEADFSYEKFNIEMPQVDSLFFYVSQFSDPNKEHLVRTPLFNLVAGMQIDQPNNHSGLHKTKNFPIFESRKESYVYYDRPYVQKGLYTRDRFYYKLNPFTMRNLVNFKTDSLVFTGVLVSAGIFPDIKEPLKVQSDYSLGFIMETPPAGYPAYGGKGKFTHTIDLSYRGFHGRGTLDYLTSRTESDAILFLPDSMFSKTKSFEVREEQGFPSIKNGNTWEKWYPYMDSMYIAQLKDETPFTMYKGASTLNGYVALRPSGALASGDVTLGEGQLHSDRFELATSEMNSNVSSIVLQSDIYKNTAFMAQNMRSKVDYKARRAEFVANDSIEKTSLPLLEYQVQVDKFSWLMDDKIIELANSKSENDQGMASASIRDRVAAGTMPGATFTSTKRSQGGLHFNALHGRYSYNTVELSCRGVFRIDVADAAIAPGNDTLHISAHADMKIMPKSRILVSRENRYHEFYDADVIVASADEYSAKGTIDYVGEDKKPQPIFMTEIAPKNGKTVALGFVPDNANFKLNEAFGYAGNVRVESDSLAFFFDGGVRLMHECYPVEKRGLLAYKGYIDASNVQLEVPEVPMDWKGNTITASILFDQNNLQPRSAFLTNERATDNELLSSFGFLEYDLGSKTCRIASKEKLEDPEEVGGRLLTLNTANCQISGEGPINFGIRKGVGGNMAYGTVSLDPNDVDNMQLQSVFGITFPMDDKVVEALGRLIKDDLRLAECNSNNPLLRNAMMFYMGDEAGDEAYSDYAGSHSFEKTPKEFNQTILFEKIPWKYSTAMGYYYDGVAPLAQIGKTQLHVDIRVKAQIFRRGKNHNVNLYLQVARDHWYYFSYEANTQQLTIYSSVGEWVDMIKGISASDRQKSDNTGTFHYRVGTVKTEVPNFLLKFGSTDKIEDASIDGDDEEEDVPADDDDE